MIIITNSACAVTRLKFENYYFTCATKNKRRVYLKSDIINYFAFASLRKDWASSSI